MYIVDNTSTLFAMDASTGKPLWAKIIPNLWSFYTPTLANGMLYTGGSDHKLYAIDLASGDVKWSFATGDFIASSPCVTGSDGSIYYRGVIGRQFY